MITLKTWLRTKVLVFIYLSSVLYTVKTQEECIRDLSKVATGVKCRKSCTSDEECKGDLKRCHCDRWCGMTCFNPDAECLPPPPIENGEGFGPSFAYGKEIQYKCDEGYILKGESKRYCQSNRQWSGVEPNCEPSCSYPPRYSESFSDASGTGFEVGTITTYTCRHGYEMTSGNGKIECLPELIWSEPNFICSKITCGNPGEPINGYIDGNHFDFGSTIYYRCNKGYVLDAPRLNRRFCSSTGRWSGAQRTCNKIECSSPENPENGFVDISGKVFKFQTIVTYDCDRGFQLIGSNKGECNEEGNWGPVPTCSIDVNCNFDGFSNAFCGYTNQGEGIWERQFLQEDTNSGNPSYVLRATTKPATFRSPFIPGSQPQCFKFYYSIKSTLLDNNRLVISTTNGEQDFGRIYRGETMNKWVGRQLTVYPGILGNGVQFDIHLSGKETKIDLDDFSLSSGICRENCHDYACENGGTCVDRISNFVCLCGRFFKGDTCGTRITCSKIPDIKFGSYKVESTTNDLTVDAVVKFSCDKGYFHAEGPKSIFCKANGEWSKKKIPVCKEITCERIWRPRSGFLQIDPDPEVLRVGTVAKYLCPIGTYIYRGPEYLVCMADGKWSSKGRAECRDLVPQRDECPGDYRRIDHSMLCYKEFKEEETYEVATSICASEGARLAVIQSQEKRRMFSNVAIRNVVYYVGLDDVGKQKIEWVNGDEFVKISSEGYDGNYKPKKSMTDESRCGTYVSSLQATQISLRSCAQERRFICEKFALDAMPVKVQANELSLGNITGVYRPKHGIIYNGAHVYKHARSGSDVYLLRTENNGVTGWAVGSFDVSKTSFSSEQAVIQAISDDIRPVDVTEPWTFGKTFGEQYGKEANVYILFYDMWKQWGEWSECSRRCGEGSTTRYRECSLPDSEGYGDCVGESGQSQKCNIKQCIPTKWSTWGSWSTCTLACGSGFQTRRRICTKDPETDDLCPGKSWDSQRCNKHECDSVGTRWISSGDIEYKLIWNLFLLPTASAACAAESSQLAIIHSSAVVDTIRAEADIQHCGRNDSHLDWELWLNASVPNDVNKTMGGYLKGFPTVNEDSNCTLMRHKCDQEPNMELFDQFCDTYFALGAVCQRDRDPCRSNPCKNGGMCEKVTADEFKCKCTDNYRGMKCNQKITCRVKEMRQKYVVEDAETYGAVTRNSVMRSTKVKLSCKTAGQVTTSNQYFTCTGQNKWNRKPQIICKNTCSVPKLHPGIIITNVETGEIAAAGENVPVRTLLVFSCKDDMELIGENTADCKNDGWDQVFPTNCRTLCRLPQLHENMTVINEDTGKPAEIGEMFKVNSLISFKCPDTLKLAGKASAECQDGVGWDVNMPTCAGNCEIKLNRLEHSIKPLDSKLNILTEDTSFTPGDTAYLQCFSGKESKFIQGIVCVGGEEWNPPIPSIIC